MRVDSVPFVSLKEEFVPIPFLVQKMKSHSEDNKLTQEKMAYLCQKMDLDVSCVKYPEKKMIALRVVYLRKDRVGYICKTLFCTWA